ncbi:MAG: Nitrate/nitrite response regulator protein [uncultured Rubrobacteraceae bacterium]|uniref:Nitrate/nitrite response regulator protein n=1 Tax=uncultured Rubrobacteraceae bacterium TaxID=349277 RepID=A0A6J4S7S1_9ACTN|nr:MAG: Nitrate/nitrite response regulator protein [uncultured Rubrobacteraceae bacterium]
MPEASKIRVLVADDHAGFRHGLVALLASDPGVEVVGEAEDGHEAVEKSLKRSPDVVLMDLQMLGPEIARKLTGFLRHPAADPSGAFPELTAREREILGLIARGVDNAGISARLFLSPNTVRNHISRVFAKLGAANRAQAIVLAREAGMGGEGS